MIINSYIANTKKLCFVGLFYREKKLLWLSDAITPNPITLLTRLCSQLTSKSRASDTTAEVNGTPVARIFNSLFIGFKRLSRSRFPQLPCLPPLHEDTAQLTMPRPCSLSANSATLCVLCVVRGLLYVRIYWLVRVVCCARDICACGIVWARLWCCLRRATCDCDMPEMRQQKEGRWGVEGMWCQKWWGARVCCLSVSIQCSASSTVRHYRGATRSHRKCV